MWHLGNYFCLIAFLSTRKLLILKKERKGKKSDQHCLQKFVSFGEQWYDAWEREGAGGREARVQLEESSCRGGRLGADSCGRKCKNRKAGKSTGLRFPMHSGLCLMGPFSVETWLLMVLSKDSIRENKSDQGWQGSRTWWCCWWEAWSCSPTSHSLHPLLLLVLGLTLKKTLYTGYRL